MDPRVWRVRECVVVLAVGAVLGVSGCSSGSGSEEGGGTSAPVVTTGSAPDSTEEPVTTEEASSTTAPQTTTAVPTTAAPEWTPQQRPVVEAYLAAIRATTTALEQPDPSASSLEEHFADVALSELRSLLRSWQDGGRAVRPTDTGRLDASVLQVHLDGSRAELLVCLVDTLTVEVGGVAEPADPTSTLGRSMLRLDDGRWRIIQQSVASTDPGTGGCEDPSA